MSLTNITTKEIIWLFGIFIGCSGLPIGVFFSGQDLMVIESYKQILPSLTFIATSIAIVNVIEALDLTLELKTDNITEQNRKIIVIWFMVNIIMAFFYFITFVSDISKAVNINYIITWFDVFLKIAMVFAATILALKVRRVLGAAL